MHNRKFWISHRYSSDKKESVLILLSLSEALIYPACKNNFLVSPTSISRKGFEFWARDCQFSFIITDADPIPRAGKMNSENNEN